MGLLGIDDSAGFKAIYVKQFCAVCGTFPYYYFWGRDIVRKEEWTLLPFKATSLHVPGSERKK